MDVFTQLKQTISDFDMCWNLLEAAEREMMDIIYAVSDRIERDKAAHAERVENLTAQSVNQASKAILRELAARELEQIQGRTFGPSESETAAFNSSMNGAQAALLEVKKTRTKLNELFEAAKVELRTMREEAYKNHSRDPLLSERVIKSRWEAFNRLSTPGE